jgi:hypothetical protein
MRPRLFEPIPAPMTARQRLPSVSLGCVVAVLATALSGCGFDRLDAPLPNAVAGFTLRDLRDIQIDETLTPVQARDAVRAAVGAPDTPEGDRLVNFLLNLNIP